MEANAKTSRAATTTSGNTISQTEPSSGASSSAPTSHKSGPSSDASSTLGAVAVSLVLAIAATVYFFVRRRKRKAASPPDHPHEEARPGPHELEPKDVPVKTHGVTSSLLSGLKKSLQVTGAKRKRWEHKS
jgi:hypothetical protein